MPRTNHHDTRRPPTPALLRAAAAALAPVLVAAAAAGQLSQPGAVLTLDAALREIASHSTAAATSGLDLHAAAEGTRRAQASLHPTLSLTGGYQARDHNIVAKFGTLRAPEAEQDFLTGELDLSYLLWDGGRRQSAISSSRSLEAATAQRGSADVRSTQLDGLAAYLRVLTFKAQRQVLAQRAAALKDHLRQVQDMFDQGVVARNDLLETEVRLRLVEDQSGQVDNGEAVAAESLNRLMGRDPARPLVLPERLPSPPPLPAVVVELERRAADTNPQLLALAARLKAEEDVVTLRKSDSAPTVFAEASHTYQQNRYLVYPNANLVFLGVSWQAYDGGAREASVREAEFAAARTREEIADLKRQLAIQIDQAYRDYSQAVREAATAETNVRAAEENLRIEEDQYKAGLVRTTDVLDAESVLAESRFSLVNQHYDAYLKQGVLLTAAGEDLPTFFAAVGSRGQEQ
ncbi:MAG TPA: TolC family protein [Thermoanaerobaculaceae bacterium]|nr:TolC family protein [Thermoanaerobaculaceae bacterium]